VVGERRLRRSRPRFGSLSHCIKRGLDGSPNRDAPSEFKKGHRLKSVALLHCRL
jgi:hypothetical protein